MLKEKQIIGLRLSETLLMAELFGKSDGELIKEAKEISKKTEKEPIYITNPQLTHRYYCLFKELKRRKFNVPAFDFITDLEFHLNEENRRKGGRHSSQS